MPVPAPWSITFQPRQQDGAELGTNWCGGCSAGTQCWHRMRPEGCSASRLGLSHSGSNSHQGVLYTRVVLVPRRTGGWVSNDYGEGKKVAEHFHIMFIKQNL